MVRYVCVNSAFMMKDYYFVLFKKKKLVFIVLDCKYAIYVIMYIKMTEDELLFFACLYVVS